MRYAPMSLIVGFFLVGITVPIAVKDLDLFRTWPPDLAVFAQPAFWLTIVIVGWSLTRRMHRGPEPITMGLLIGWTPAIKGVLIGFACSLPMAALGLMCVRKDIDYTIVYSTLLPGVIEEILFRAFAFGLLVQAARVRMWPAAIGTGVLFGLAHLIHASIRAEPLADQFGWIGMIAAGGLLYAWLYARSTWNLWVVIALHASMNLWWELFELNSSSLGVAGATVSRVLAVGIAIAVVVFGGALRPAANTEAA